MYERHLKIRNLDATDVNQPRLQEYGIRIKKVFLLFLTLLIMLSFATTAQPQDPEKRRIMVVDSYHREYLWSQHTHEGFCAAMLEFGYFDNKAQIAEFTKNDFVETSKMVIKKLWMDTKRKHGRNDIVLITVEFNKIAREFEPDLIFLGDDNAANYIGNQFLDSKIPLVFWGLNSSPLKYGLIESVDRPGHNVTGVYQPGFFLESLQLLKKLAPTAKTLAIISDDSETGRANYKTVERLARKRLLPFELVEIYSTGDFEKWKERVLKLQEEVDAFFIGHYASFKTKQGKYLPPEEAVKWYVTHSTLPEAMSERQFVEQGILCTAEDSGFKQGYEAVLIGRDILESGADPSTYAPVAPTRGHLVVNRQRAEMLNIVLTDDMGIEEYIDEIPFLEN